MPTLKKRPTIKKKPTLRKKTTKTLAWPDALARYETHLRAKRSSERVLVCANLAAIPESLLEAERRALLAASRYRAKNGRLRPERRSPWRGRPRHS